MSDDKRARAEALWEQINQFPAREPTDAYTEMTLDHVFGELWSRPGLTRKERRLITLTSIASAGAQTALDVHVRSALASGDFTKDEMIEFALHFAHYGGWPLSAQLYTTILRTHAELETSEE
jgi:4-carboxymuconolactone decarboxylase